jgi:signal transduction histidine kinase/CHASE3 domain sensor protein
MPLSTDVGMSSIAADPRLRSFPLLAAFLVVTLLFTGAGIVNYRAVQTLVANQRDQVNQRVLAIELQNLLRLALMAESGQRGFVITGLDDYLAPYHEARQRMPQTIAGLRTALAADAGQMQRLEQVAAIQERKFAELEQSIAARRAAGFAAAQQIVLTNQGKQYMDQLRSLTDQMERIEQAKLNQRRVDSANNADRAFRTAMLAAVLEASLMLLLFMLVRSDARRRGQEAQRLEDSRTLLRNVLDGLPVLICLKDRLGSLRLMNRAYAALFGASPAAAPADGHDEQVLRQGDTLQYEEQLATPLGMRHFISSRLPLRDHRGAVVGVCAVSSDVTSLKQAESALRELNRTLEHRVAERTRELDEANRRLEQANTHLEAYDYTVAHDLRAPLRAIHGFAEALDEDYARVLDAAGRDYLLRIRHAAERMEQLIEDLLAFSRLSDDALPAHAVDLDGLLDDLRLDLAATLAAAGAELETRPPLGMVMANHAACLQVLHNLISNAIKFRRLEQRQQIRIWSEPAPCNANQADHACLRVWVEDCGIGLEAADCERIFRPFERLHGIDEYPGSGIGLAIVAQAVKRMHGRCGAEPAAPGARFWFELPRAPAAAVAMETKEDDNRHTADR